MKKSLSIYSFILLVLSLLIFIGCSKQVISPEQENEYLNTFFKDLKENKKFKDKAPSRNQGIINNHLLSIKLADYEKILEKAIYQKFKVISKEEVEFHVTKYFPNKKIKTMTLSSNYIILDDNQENSLECDFSVSKQFSGIQYMNIVECNLIEDI